MPLSLLSTPDSSFRIKGNLTIIKGRGFIPHYIGPRENKLSELPNYRNQATNLIKNQDVVVRCFLVNSLPSNCEPSLLPETGKLVWNRRSRVSYKPALKPTHCRPITSTFNIWSIYNRSIVFPSNFCSELSRKSVFSVVASASIWGFCKDMD